MSACTCAALGSCRVPGCAVSASLLARRQLRIPRDRTLFLCWPADLDIAERRALCFWARQLLDEVSTRHEPRARCCGGHPQFEGAPEAFGGLRLQTGPCDRYVYLVSGVLRKRSDGARCVTATVAIVFASTMPARRHR